MKDKHAQIEYKQVILVREDLKMSAGKLGAQVGHASVEATLKSDRAKIEQWRRHGMKKVVLSVKDENELLKYKKTAVGLKLTNALIVDAGRTFFDKPTTTCLAIGPDKEDKIDKVTGHLKMLK